MSITDKGIGWQQLLKGPNVSKRLASYLPIENGVLQGPTLCLESKRQKEPQAKRPQHHHSHGKRQSLSHLAAVSLTLTHFPLLGHFILLFGCHRTNVEATSSAAMRSWRKLGNCVLLAFEHVSDHLICCCNPKRSYSNCSDPMW